MQERVRGKSGIERDSGGHRTAGPWSGRSRLVRWAGCWASCSGIVACSEPARPPLVVGINTWVGYDPLVLGRDRGLADARQVKVVELISSAEALRHLRNGLLDAAGLDHGRSPAPGRQRLRCAHRGAARHLGRRRPRAGRAAHHEPAESCVASTSRWKTPPWHADARTPAAQGRPAARGRDRGAHRGDPAPSRRCAPNAWPWR